MVENMVPSTARHHFNIDVIVCVLSLSSPSISVAINHVSVWSGEDVLIEIKRIFCSITSSPLWGLRVQATYTNGCRL